MGEYPYPVPESIEDDYENSYALMVPEVKAGSVLIFTEALTHGSVSWKAQFERRALLFRYSGRNEQHTPEPMSPPRSVKLTDSQHFLFEAPGARSFDQIPRRVG